MNFCLILRHHIIENSHFLILAAVPLKNEAYVLGMLDLNFLLVEENHLVEQVVEFGGQLHFFNVEVFNFGVFVLIHYLEAWVHKVFQIYMDELL